MNFIKIVKSYILYPLMFIMINVIALLLFAKAIERGLLSVTSSGDLILVSIIFSTFICIFFATKNTPSLYVSACLGGVFLLSLLLLSFLLNRDNILTSTLIRNVISIFCGSLLGFVFGKRKYNKEKNTARKRSRTKR